MAHTLSQTLTQLVGAAATAAGFADSPVPLEACVPCNNPDHGDYQSNYAFRVGKAMRTNPRAVAQQIADAIPAHPAILQVDVAGPGFLNFRLKDDFLAADVSERTQRETLGMPQVGEGRTVVIDFSSPNVAKRMHIGHLRSTVIGDALRRLYSFGGWTVVADNHVGDWGTQFGMLIVGWRHWRDEAAYETDPIAELQRLYQLFRERVADQPDLHDEARAATAALQSGDPSCTELWRRFIDASMVEFEGVYSRLDVHFDVAHGESHYREAVQPLIDDLLERGIAVVNEGAVVVPFTAEDGKGLGKNPLLIRKSDGAALYGTTDLATVLDRQKNWSPERMVYVTDGRQQQHFRHVFAASRKMGVCSVDFQHVWFGMLVFPDGSIASTRKGAAANLVDVLDTAVARARSLVDAHSGSLSEAQRAEIAEVVGLGAVKYFDLSQNRQSDITFDWDRSLALEGNSAPYLMYAHARCCSLVARAAEQGLTPGTMVLADPAERSLALKLARTPEVIANATEVHRPNLLCDHLFEVAQDLSRFYAACRVMGGDVDEDTSRSRLALAQGTARVLSTGLGLLGIGAPSRM